MNTIPVKCMVCGVLGDMPYDSETSPDMASIIGRLWRCADCRYKKVRTFAHFSPRPKVQSFKPKHVEAKPKPAARLPYQE